MRIAIFGGTFDPPHNAHTQIVHQAIRQLELDKVIVFPCGIPWHKQTDTSSSTHRVNMTRLAMQNLPVEIDNYELNKQGNTYTIDTVQYVQKQYPNSQIILIIGGDSYMQLHSWHQSERLLPMVSIAVAPRSAETNRLMTQSRSVCSPTTILEVEFCDISSTNIRTRAELGMDISAFTCDGVAQYIVQHRLYSKYSKIVDYVKATLSPCRFEHTCNVALKAVQLDDGVDYDKAVVASLLHDCAKELDEDSAKMYNINLCDRYNWHAEIGAVLAQQKFGITDDDILNAIRYHTTGRAEMSRLEKIIYLADKLEDSRHYPTQHLFKNTLDQTLLAVMVEIEQLLTRQGEKISDLTTQAIQYYSNFTRR